MAKRSFREQEYLRRAQEILAEQAKKNTPTTTAGMPPQQKAEAAKNTAYENVLKAFIAQSNLQASDPVKNRAGDVLAYALQDPAQRNVTANVLLSGEGTKLIKGDIKNWDAGTARNAIIENELFMEVMRDAGMYDAPEYATSNQYNTLASTNYLKQLLEEQNREWEAVRQKNAQADEWKNKYENDRDFRATWQYWNELYNMQYKMTEDNAPFFWAYADYLQGDRSKPFDAEKLEQLWMEMPDEAFYREMERLQKQYESIDLEGIATANSPERADDSGFVQSTTNIETELERREQLDYFNKLASEIVAYEKENRGVDPTVYTSPFDYAYEDINHGTVEGSRQLAAMMNDLGYYINNVEQLSYGQHGEIGTGNYWNLDFELSGYNFLTETEKNRYNALSSIGLGDAYLRALEADLLRRRAMWQENRDTVYAENPVTGVAGSVGTVVTQPLTATMTLAAGIAGENNPNAPAYDMQRWQNTTRGVRGEIWGDMMSFDVLGQPVGTTIYNTFMSMADMGYAMLLSGGLAGGKEAFAKAGMQFIMSSEAAASTLHADLERGFSAEQALLHGIANGAVEAITEKLPIDTLFTKDGKFLWRVLKSGLSEGGEEVASGVLQLGTDALASYMAGKESEVEATYKEYAKTMSHEEAALATLKHYAQDIALQGLSGFGSGGMLGTVTHATNDARVRGAGKNVQTQGDVDAMITIAEGMGEGTQSRQWAERLKGKKKGNGKYSNYDVGRLTMALEQEVGAELAEAPNQVMDEAIEGRLLELGETPENAKALAPVVRQTYRGQPIKRSVARAVNWNDHADQVVKELSRETTEEDAGRTGVDWANRAKDSQAATEQAAEKARRVKEAALGKGVPKAKMAPEAEGSVKKSAGKAAQKGEQLAELGKAVIKGDGKQSTAISYETEEGSKQGEVVRFAEVDGSMQLVVEEEAEGGKTERTVAPEDIGAAATKGLGAVIAYVTDESERQRRMSEQEANTMLLVYNETGGDAQEFIEGYEAAYLAGYAGIEVPAVNIDSRAAELAYRYGAQNAQADEANRATRAGRRGAQGTGTVTWLGTVSSNAEVTGKGGDISAAMETMTESQRTTAEVVQALAKQMSIDVTLFESSADMMEGIQNGSFVPGTNRIYIDVNSGAANAQSLTEQKANGTLGYAMVKTMAHELTHYMESNSAEGYAAYKQAVKNALKESGQDWATLVRGKLDAAILAGNKLTLAGAEAEVIADASEYMLQNSAFVQGLDNSVRGKVKQFIQNFMEKVRAIFANLTGGHRESAALRKTIDGVMQYTGNLQRLWDAGIREATGRNYTENATMRTGTTVQAATDQNTSQTEEAVEEWTTEEESSEDLAEEWTPAEEADEEIWTPEEDVQSTDEQLAEEIYKEPAKAVAEERTVQEVIEKPTVKELKQEAKATQKIAPQELIQGIADRFGIDIRVVDRGSLLASYNPDSGEILIGENASTGEVLYKAVGMELMRHAQNSQYAKQLQSAVSLAAYAGNPDGYFADLQAVADEMNQRFDNYGKRKLTAESPIVQAEVFARMAAKVFGNESSMMTLIEQNFSKPTLLQRIRNALKNFVQKLRGLKTPAMTPVQRAEYLLGQALKDAQKAAANPAKSAQLLENFVDTHVDAANRQTLVAYTTMMGEEAALEVDADRGEVQYSIRDSQGKELVMNQQDLENNKKTISGMASVTTASGNRFVNLDGANYRRAVQGYFDNEGKTFTNPTVGDVRITTSGMKHLTRYKSTLKSALVPCVRGVIENGLVVDIDDNHAMRGEPTVVLAAPVTLDNKEYYMGVAVRQANNLDKLYHIHEAALIEQEKGDHPATKTEPLQAEPSPDGHPSIYSILDSIRKYNRESVDLNGNDVQYSTRGQTETEEFKRWFGNSVVVNEDGTPKVMYHGTATEFWSFDKHKANDATGRKLGLGAGKGKFYLSEFEGVGKAAADSARSMGKGKNPKVMELYVSAQKVMDRQEYDKRLKTAYGKYPNSNPQSVAYDYRARDKAIAEVDRQIRKEGYDGVWDRDSGEMFVYEPTQIKSATDNVGTFDPENADIRYSSRAGEYMDAAINGDTEKAQRLVDEAAEVALKDSKLRTPDGKLRKVYHGTNSTNFNVFDSDYIGAASGDDGFFGMGFYFAYTAGEASYYGRKRIISAYLDMKKPFNFMEEFYKYKGNRASSGYAPDAVSIMNFSDKFPDIAKKMTITVEYAGDDSTKRIPYAEFAKAYKDVIDNKKFDYQEITNEFGDKETLVTADVQYHEYEYKGETRRFKDYGFQKRFYGQPNQLDVAYEYLVSRVFEYVDMPRFTRVILDNNRAFTQTLINRGYDGTIQSEDGDEACVFESSQIKSAEPITYDDAGNIIPLGERFSRENPDIRYSTRTPEDTLSIREYLGEMKPTARMNETEKIMLKRYQEQLKILREKEQLVAQQDEIIRTAPANSEELTKAKNRRNIYRAQANRAARALAEAERNDGFARLMATSQEVVNRYLLGSAGNVADAADALDTEVADLTKKLKTVEADVTRTASAQRTAFARGLFDQQTLNKAAQKLKDTYGSRMPAKTIADRLALAYGEIYADDSAEGAKRFAEAVKELASDILAGHKYRYKSEVLPMLQEKIGTFSLTETDLQEIRNAGMTVSEYKKMLSPWVKVSEGASDLSSFASNAAYYGDGALAAILGEETEGNLAMNLYNIIQQEKAQEQEIGVEGMSEGQMITAVMADIAGSDMPLSTNSKTVDYLRNELKRFAGESAEAAQNIEQAIMNARKATGKASDVWRAAVKEVETAKQAVEYYRKLEEQRRLTELKELKQTITEELKTENAKNLQEKVKAQREEFRAREQKAREYRRTRDEVNKLRRSIGRSVKRLNGLRVRETDQKHVPEELQYMADLVMETFTESSLARLAFSGSKAASLSTTYANLLKLESDATHYWDDEIEQTMQNLSDLSAQYTALATRQEGAPTYFSLEGVQLEQEILTGVQDIVDNVMQMIDSQNKQFVEGRNETFEQYAEEAGKKLKRHKDYKLKAGWAGDAKQAIDEFLFKGNVTPVYYFEHLENEEFKGLFDRIRKGQSDYAKIVSHGQKIMREAKRRHNYSRWVGDKKLTLKTAQGHTITLTREQALWAYATAKREQANKLYKTEHLQVGGFQYKSTRDIKGEKGNRAVDVQHQLKQSDIDQIGKWLTDEQKAYADELVQYLSTDIADYGNQASMEMYGYKKFKEKYYFPFRTKSDQRYLRGDEGPTGEDAGTGRIKNAGFTHKVQHKANQTLVMDDFSTVIADHVQKMAAYAAMVQPVEDLKRLLNYRTETEDGNQPTLRALLGQKYGMPAQNYMTQLLKDLNGATQSDERAMTIPSKLVNAFKRGAVAASLSVVLQQPTAMARAMAYINPKHFASNPFYRPSKGLWDEMMQYAGTAVIKDMGKFDVGMGLTASQYIADEEMSVFEAWRRLRNESLGKANKAVYDRFLEWLTAAPGAADQWTWGLIWKAVKHEQAELHPGMNTSSEEFLKLCGARFDDVIDHTQVYDSVLTRSNLMRSRNGLQQAATAFMSEPTLSLNMLYDALTGKHSGKQRAGIIGSVIASQVLAGAMAALVQAWNDDEDESNWLEKYAGRATSNILDNLNPLGMIPYIGNILDIFSGYEVNRPDMEVVNDIIQYGKKYFKAFEDGGRPSWKETENFIGTLTNLLGIPYKNISREVRRTKNAIINTDWSAPDMKNVGNAVLENVSILGINPWGSAKKDYYERMVTAMMQGNTDEANDYRDYLMESKGSDADAIIEGVRDAYKARYEEGGIAQDEAVQFLLDNDLVKGDTPEKRRMKAFEYVDKWDEGEAGGGVYVSIKAAMHRGDMATVDREIEELISYGWTANAVYSEMNSEAKKAYIEGKISKDAYKRFYEKHGIAAGKAAKDDNDWYWTFRELDYAKGNGGSTEGYDMHAELWQAVDTGTNLRATINEYQSHGRTREDLNRAMNDHYKQILIDLYQTNRAEFTRVQARVLTAYAQLGYDREQKRKTIENWVK